MRTTYLTATLLAVACLLAACGGGETAEPIFTPSTSNTSTSPSPSTTDQEDPEDFIRRWQALGDEMQNTGDTGLYRNTYLPSCDACEGFADAVDEIYADGGRVEFPRTMIKSLTSRGGGVFDLNVTVPETKVFAGATAEPQVLPGSSLIWEVQLRQRGGTWFVARYSKRANP